MMTNSTAQNPTQIHQLRGLAEPALTLSFINSLKGVCWALASARMGKVYALRHRMARNRPVRHAGTVMPECRVTGQLFQQHCRQQDVVVRYSGDKSAVLFWDPVGPRVAGSGHPGGVPAVLVRFNASLRSQQFPLLGPTGVGRLTISGGLATYPWVASSREELFKKADDALLAAKRAGKNRILLIVDADSHGI